MPLFAVYAPDYTDDDAINRRLAVREAHLARSASNPGRSELNTIFWLSGEAPDLHVTHSEIGGAMVSPNDALDGPNKERKMAGSVMIWECESYAAARAWLEGDPYWKGNVVSANISRTRRCLLVR